MSLDPVTIQAMRQLAYQLALSTQDETVTKLAGLVATLGDALIEQAEAENEWMRRTALVIELQATQQKVIVTELTATRELLQTAIQELREARHEFRTAADAAGEDDDVRGPDGGSDDPVGDLGEG